MRAVVEVAVALSAEEIVELTRVVFVGFALLNSIEEEEFELRSPVFTPPEVLIDEVEVGIGEKEEVSLIEEEEEGLREIELDSCDEVETPRLAYLKRVGVDSSCREGDPTTSTKREEENRRRERKMEKSFISSSSCSRE